MRGWDVFLWCGLGFCISVIAAAAIVVIAYNH